MGKRKEEPGLEGAPEWITTFVDMISLLVTFFILLFTFSSLEDYQRFHFPQNILGQSGIMEGSGSSSVEAPKDDLMSAMHPTHGAQDPHSRPTEALQENAEHMGQKQAEDELELDGLNNELVLHFAEAASFGPGETAVTASLKRSLTQLADVIQHYPNPIVVEGHTDSEFKPSPRYPTAEALSCARAVAAARILLAGGAVSPKRVRVAGLSATRPLNDNLTARERTRNRRVEIRVLPVDTTLRNQGN